MSARSDILAALRAIDIPTGARPAVPDFADPALDAVAEFTAALARLDGTVATPAAAELAGWVLAAHPEATRICTFTPEIPGTVDPAALADWAAPADLDVVVLRTPLGVAETGSILVTEREADPPTAAVLAAHLVVLLDPADLVADLHHAYRHPALHEAGYAVLLSGPSGSADIGGVTVHPAQGVTTLTVLLAPRGTGAVD